MSPVSTGGEKGTNSLGIFKSAEPSGGCVEGTSKPIHQLKCSYLDSVYPWGEGLSLTSDFSGAGNSEALGKTVEGKSGGSLCSRPGREPKSDR